MTVYITHEVKKNARGWSPDLTPAGEYGALKYVFNSGEQPFKSPQDSVEKVFQILNDFEEANDYILWPNSGDPAAVWVIVMTLVKMGHEKLTFLYWNRKRGDNGEVVRGAGYYTPVKIDVSHLFDGSFSPDDMNEDFGNR